ncbi:hypothetical protein [Pararhodospirillum oryzae]|uniref:Uncharacterized protein n=1 Tax=Pararhodospirillum oryzae TaxID=478448 RepID=A0A512HA73_9PROT|nr:hypothetical protein [Pararhodospirillum oryzae]GEO82290.1 hypothetical protein ROR02_24210 [Pararhodospirillum oryzae]
MADCLDPEGARALLRMLGVSQAQLGRVLTAARTDGRQTTPATVSHQLNHLGSYPALALLLVAWAAHPELVPAPTPEDRGAP